MTDALDKARREAQEACPCRRTGDPGCVRDELVNICDHAPIRFALGLPRVRCEWLGHDAIARLEAAALDAAYERGQKDAAHAWSKAETRRTADAVAAARLAGRIQQAEKMCQINNECDTAHGRCLEMENERDRLRAEAEKEKS